MQKIKTYAKTHKVVSSVVVILVLFIGYYGYKYIFPTATTSQYFLGTVTRGNLISSVSGSGQVSASNQVDLKSKASGDILYLGVKAGQYVSAGNLIAKLDTTIAEKAVRDAEINLETANLSLQKLQEPADTLSRIQAENSLTQANTNLQKTYDDGFSTISSTFLDLPDAMTGLQNILYGTVGNQDYVSYYADLVKDYDPNVSVYKDVAESKYAIARTAYDASFNAYKATNRSSSTSTIEALVLTTYDATRSISEAIKSSSDLINFVKDRLTTQNKTIPTILNTNQSSLSSYTSKINSDFVNLSTIKNNLVSYKQSITVQTLSLEKLNAGADALDLRSSKLSVAQKENALLDAKKTLENYYVRAPFSGIIAKVNVKLFDSAGASTVIATLTTNQKIAEITLNEVDVAKVSLGDKVTLTFDAIDGLSITGKVAEIDTLGTVSQGVVTYAIKISFDTQDVRVKSGMSVSASIITDVKSNVLIVPGSAVKSQSGTKYVQMFDPAPTGDISKEITSSVAPINQAVEIGESNDTEIEILAGLNEGDLVVIRTTTGVTTTTSAPSLLNAVGGRTTGGSTTRIPGGIGR